MEINPKYRGRARAAAWSKSILAVAAVLSVLLLPFGVDFESVVIVIGVVVVTFFEYRVHRYFVEGDGRGPVLGFRNQSGFAAVILVYGLYHFVAAVPVPPELRGMIDDQSLQLIQTTIRDGYLAIGLLGGLSQFALAWYYRQAGPAETAPPAG
jgi:hypothetical protein